MAAHLQEATIVGALAANKDRFHRRSHVVVDAAPARALEEGEAAVVGVEHHFLALARVGARKQHARVAEPQMGDLDLHGRAVDQHHLVAPVELVGLARRERERDVGLGRHRRPFPPPRPGVPAHGVVAALVAQGAQRLEDTRQGQPLAGGLGRVGQQQAIQLGPPLTELGQRLDLALVGECRGARAHHLAHRVARHVQVPDDLLDRAAADEELAPDARNRVHALHPPAASSNTGKDSLQNHG